MPSAKGPRHTDIITFSLLVTVLLLTPFWLFATIVVCSFSCLCTSVAYIANNTGPDQTAPTEQSDQGS